MFPGERVPDKIGAYSVTKYVGQSGTADVYVARMDGPLGFQRTVTLKMVRYAMEDDARFAEELAREAAICARLNHPAVVRMFDFFEHERRIVLVLEQIEGASLEKLSAHLSRRKQKLADNAVLTIGYQIASALAHAHAAVDDDGNATPVIHRNVQPENVLISWDGHVRLSGFGLGKILGRTPDSIAGTVSGTPGFMSPEQARGERATVRSDVYGLGLLLWTLFTDREAPSAETRPESLSELRPDIPREISAAIDAALEASPDRRRITCHDIAQWLAKVMNAEKGREELRQKVLALRASRSPVGEVTDTGRSLVTRPNARPRRRQTLGNVRASSRRSASVASSFPAPPPSSRASHLRSSSAPEGSEPPPDSSKTLRFPPPPPLPADDTRRALRSTGSQLRPASIRPAGSQPPRPSQRPSQGPSQSLSQTQSQNGAPATLRPGGSAPPRTSSGISVRPVSVVPPPRSQPPIYGLHLPLVPPSGAPTAPTPSWMTPRFDPSGQHGFGAESFGSQRPAPQSAHPGGFGLPDGQPGTNGSNGLSLDPVDLGVLQGEPLPMGPGGYRVRSQERTLTPAQQILLTTLTAAVVVAIGLFVLQRTSAATANAHATTAAPVAVQSAAAPTTTQADRAPSDRSSGDGNHATPVLDTKTQGPDASVLSEQLAYLTVKGPAEADVYINGMRKGPTNQPIVVPCGRWFLRLAPPNPGRFPAWLGKGETVLIACRQTTVLNVNIDDDPATNPSTPRDHGTFGL